MINSIDQKELIIQPEHAITDARANQQPLLMQGGDVFESKQCRTITNLNAGGTGPQSSALL